MSENLYERYAKIRDVRGLTDYKVANITKIGTPTISNWKNGKYIPKDDKMQAIATALDVPYDFLLGRTDMVVCPVCGFGNNPLSEQSRKEHEQFHEKFKKAQEKYPFILPYRNADELRSIAISEFRNIEIPVENRLAAYDCYLETSYSLVLSRRNYEYEDYSYDEFCKTEIASIKPDYIITNGLIEMLAETYGVDKEFIGGTDLLLSRADSQMLRLLKYYELLTKEQRNMIEVQVKALADQKEKE